MMLLSRGVRVGRQPRNREKVLFQLVFKDKEDFTRQAKQERVTQTEGRL